MYFFGFKVDGKRILRLMDITEPALSYKNIEIFWKRIAISLQIQLQCFFNRSNSV